MGRKKNLALYARFFAIFYLRMLYSICGCYILFADAMWDCDVLIGGGEEELEGF